MNFFCFLVIFWLQTFAIRIGSLTVFNKTIVSRHKEIKTILCDESALKKLNITKEGWVD